MIQHELIHASPYKHNLLCLPLIDSTDLLEARYQALILVLHRREEREVKRGKGLMAKVGNMSSGTCTCEEGANSACGPKLNDQRGVKKGGGKLG